MPSATTGGVSYSPAIISTLQSESQSHLGNVPVPNNAVNWSRNSGLFFTRFHHSAFLGLAAQLPLSFGQTVVFA
jgi:hypothetical protein